MLGLSWVQWAGVAFNLAASFVNVYFALKWRRQMRARAVTYAKLVGFAAATACAPPGLVPEEVRSLARSALPEELRNDVRDMVLLTSATTRVH
jgi:hypothetical protein